MGEVGLFDNISKEFGEISPSEDGVWVGVRTAKLDELVKRCHRAEEKYNYTSKGREIIELNDRIKHLEFELGKAMGERDKLMVENNKLENVLEHKRGTIEAQREKIIMLNSFKDAIELVFSK